MPTRKVFGVGDYQDGEILPGNVDFRAIIWHKAFSPRENGGGIQRRGGESGWCMSKSVSPFSIRWELGVWEWLVGVSGNLLRKEVVKRDFGLYLICVGISDEPVGCNHCQMDGFRRLAYRSKHFGLVFEFLHCCFINREASLSEFHFAYIYNIVRPVEKEVYLCADGIDIVRSMSPCVYFSVNAGDAERSSHLFGMLQTEALKCKTAPGRLTRRRRCARPEMLIHCCAVEESEMKERKVVDELIDAVALFVPKKSVATDEAAFFESLKGVGYDSCICYAGRFCHFLPRHAHLLCGEGTYDFNIQRCVPEQRRVEFLKFSFKRCAVGKKQKVEVLCETVSFNELPPIIRNAAQCHIAFRYISSGHFKPSAFCVQFAFKESERLEKDSCGDAVVETAFVAKQFFYYPGRSGAANYQDNVLSCRGPLVPKCLKGSKKVGSRRIHPWKFINKDDFALVWAKGNVLLQGVESVKPVFGGCLAGKPTVFERLEKVSELTPFRGVCETGMQERKTVIEELSYEVGFADTSAPVYGDKFRFARFKEAG